MEAVLSYLIKLSIAISLVYLFYRFVLRRLTFYQWNRYYLLGYGLLGFVLPFLHIENIFSSVERNPVFIYRAIPSLAITANGADDSNIFYLWILYAFAGGVIFFLIKFLLQFISFHALKSRSRLLSDTGTKIFEAPGEVAPFSFGTSIFIGKGHFNEQSLANIIAHEMVHIRQKHFIDIFFAELLCIVQWYNPFAWLHRHAVKQNLEFIADNEVLQKGIDKKQYQYLLLQVMGNTAFSISTHFNFQSLKNRIAMMNKMKTTRIHALRFLFVLPLALVLLLAFRDELPKSREKPLLSTTFAKPQADSPVYRINVITPGGVPFAIAYDENGKELERAKIEFRKVKDSKGNVKYVSSEALANFEKKYGPIPPPPPPPPPPPGISSKKDGGKVMGKKRSGRAKLPPPPPPPPPPPAGW